MKTPSVRALEELFAWNAKTAKFYLTAETSKIKTKAVERLRHASFHPQKKYIIRLTALNELGGFHGVEFLKTKDDEYAEYINTGDSYAPTLIYWRGHYRIQSIGDFIETMERQHVRFN